MAHKTPTSTTPSKTKEREDVVPVDTGKKFCVLPKSQVDAGGYSYARVEGYQWYISDSFVDQASSPYGRVEVTVQGRKERIISVDPTYFKQVKCQYVFLDTGRSPPYRTRSRSAVKTIPPAKATEILKVAQVTGSDSKGTISKASGICAASPSKIIPVPVPYIRSAGVIPQIPPGQVVNPEFVRQELYARIDELYSRLDDTKSGISPQVTLLQNTVTKLQTEKRSLEDKVAVLESEVTADKIGLKSKVTVVQDQIKLMQQEIRTLKAKRMDLVTDGDDTDESTPYSFMDYDRFKKAVEEENEHMARQLQWLVASVDQNALQIDHLQIMTASNAEKLMQNTIKIGGVEEEKDVKPRQAALSFLKDTMKLKFDGSDLFFAYRQGEKRKSPHSDKRQFPRFLFIKVAPKLYHKIWNNRKSLSGKKSQEGFKYFVSLTKPAILRAADKRYGGRIREIIEEDKDKPKDQQRFAKVNNAKLFVSNVFQPDPIEPPSLKRRIELETSHGGAINDFELLESTIYPLEGSNNFQAFATRVSSFSQVELAYCRIKKENVYATHIMMGCFFEKRGEGNILFSCDDGEHEAGLEIEKALKENGLANLAVFVTRYRFKHFELGPKRFIAIREVTRKVLEKVNEVWAKEDDVRTDSGSDGELEFPCPDATMLHNSSDHSMEH